MDLNNLVSFQVSTFRYLLENMEDPHVKLSKWQTHFATLHRTLYNVRSSILLQVLFTKVI